MVNNLGSFYLDLGRFAEAEKIYLRALVGYKKALGKETIKKYILALNIAQNLANFFRQIDRTKEAEKFYG
jgi:tetratricopeptide (TPR) repeat protein